MAKNVPNELKFGLDKFENLPKIFWNFKQLIDIHCISMSYLKFQKIFGRFSKLGNFWPKKQSFSAFFASQFQTFFKRKSYQCLQKCSDLANNQYTCCILCDCRFG